MIQARGRRPAAILAALAMAVLGAGCSGGHGNASGAASSGVLQTIAPLPVDVPGTIDVNDGVGTSIPVDATNSLDSAKVQAVWWTWAMTTAAGGTPPVADPDGRSCGSGQQSGFWFLGGATATKVSRKCSITTDRVLVFPLAAYLSDSATDCASSVADLKATATLDAKAVTATSVPGDRITWYGNTAVNGGSVGLHTNWACGMWAAVPALKTGAHTLKIQRTNDAGTSSLDYALTAVAPAKT